MNLPSHITRTTDDVIKEIVKLKMLPPTMESKKKIQKLQQQLNN